MAFPAARVKLSVRDTARKVADLMHFHEGHAPLG